jgi:prevent-host-death family protein
MNSKTTISISEARKKIFEIANDVQAPNNMYTLTENGKPKAVLMSADEFESWMETLEVVKDFPDLKKDINKFENDLKDKKHKDYVSLEDVLKKHTK